MLLHLSTVSYEITMWTNQFGYLIKKTKKKKNLSLIKTFINFLSGICIANQ